MSISNKLVIASLIAIMVIVLVVTSYIRQQESTTILTSTQRIFEGQEGIVTYTDINGNEVSIKQYLGKVLVVTTWASWSPFTNYDLTTLNELMTNYNPSEVVALGINRMETREQAQRLNKPD